MDKKIKELKTGVRLNIRKPPKRELPKNIYTRKEKHKKGHGNKETWPFFYLHGRFLITSFIYLQTSIGN
ncbi:MAG TPA: hypothetical protein PK358_10420 [Spirochaetota bacterium]|nr:hypothetical protein [Spirochaetota bacterium]HPJ35240.1 hypothetical protein [Spirochaetota bacterium]